MTSHLECIECHDRFPNHATLSDHYASTKHYKVSEEWRDARYLVPFDQEDPLLFDLDIDSESDQDEDQDKGEEMGDPVDQELTSKIQQMSIHEKLALLERLNSMSSALGVPL